MLCPLPNNKFSLYENDDIDFDDDDVNDDDVEDYVDDNNGVNDDSDVQVREKEEAWRKYKDAVEEGKTAGGHNHSDRDDDDNRMYHAVQEIDKTSIFHEKLSKTKFYK